MENIDYKSRPTKAVINTKNILNNLSVVKSLIGNRKVMAILKADAYGHGLTKTAQLLQHKVDSIGVAYIEEAIILRRNKIKIPILVLGPVHKKQIKEYLNNDIDITGASAEKLIQVSQIAKKLGKVAHIHLKIDTGMGRIGVQYDRVERFFDEIFKLENIDVVGVYTHFSCADSDREYTLLQYERFEKVLKTLSKYTDIAKLNVHIANSSFTSSFNNLDLKDTVRIGLMLYGYSPNKYVQKLLKPAMTLKTEVSYFKVLEKGKYIGYGKTYKLNRQSRIVTLPIGYADGYSTEFSNKGKVYINGKTYPIVGKVCMDQCMVNIGNGEAYVGDSVELFGEKINLWNICENTSQSPYTILTAISQRVPRIYI